MNDLISLDNMESIDWKLPKLTEWQIKQDEQKLIVNGNPVDLSDNDKEGE